MSPFLETVFWLVTVCAAVDIPQPDRRPLADEWGYRPSDGAVVALNPPSLSWVHEKGAASYTVEWAQTADFRNAVSIRNLRWSVYTHHETLPPGEYCWRYRIHTVSGAVSPWSRVRRFRIPAEAVAFPQPTLAELKRRIGNDHPRLFLSRSDLPRLRDYATGAGREEFARLRAKADALLKAEPTPEPTIIGDPDDPQTRQHWWSNRTQAIQALHEGEVLSFTWLLTQDPKYVEAARRFALQLAAWKLDGPTNFAANCEAAKPMLHRLARIYDWVYPLLSESERQMFRQVLLRRAQDAWLSGEVRQGVGHLNQPYGSHANRTWHKLAENAVATLGETPESDLFLEYAVTKFFAAYPVWSDEDGGWHEGLAYFAGYMTKATWWMHLAHQALGIDGFRKPFFRHFGDYALYSSPPGSPDLGYGDNSYRSVSPEWAFLHYFIRQTKNPYWAWWAKEWKLPENLDEPVLSFLWSSLGEVKPERPAQFPPSKVFRGTGIAILNTTIENAAENVQIRFKSSPMGRWSHGHEPHNSFTLTAYGESLLVNNTYRDLYGSPFHRGWVWSTQAHNAVLVNRQGQKPHTADFGGQIQQFDLREGLDYVVGDASASYETKLLGALRHIVFVKPDVVFVVDELATPQPSTFQFLLHAQVPFTVDSNRQRLSVEREKGGVVVDYWSRKPFQFRQWTGYEPPPDKQYLLSVNRPMIPEQWHVEASTQEASANNLTVTVLRPYRKGSRPDSPLQVSSGDKRIDLIVTSAGGAPVRVVFRDQALEVQKRNHFWRIVRQPKQELGPR
ncbi:MAG: DUF4962 domain-containing protein [Bryobacteraceae bacterium]|nr:DUF4962 domain-containing protein [Bryobacteraceae bacterium]MDW8378221.1 DUF4962 domain-containing protein [Bryobacterales bacterium]